MRMILPPLQERRTIDHYLSSFFHGYRDLEFRRAVSLMCKFYRLKRPRVEWYEYLDWGKTAGKTYENGSIHLVHPENWKRGRKYNSERQWINVVYHEMGHYIYWTDAERKADTFAYRMVHGLSRKRWKNLRVAFIVNSSSGTRMGGLCQTATRKRTPTRTTGGSSRVRAASGPNRKNDRLRLERSSSRVLKTTTKSRRASI